MLRMTERGGFLADFMREEQAPPLPRLLQQGLKFGYELANCGISTVLGKAVNFTKDEQLVMSRISTR